MTEGEGSQETWLPADGSPGVAHLEFDHLGIARVTRECLAMLLGRAGFVQVDNVELREQRG